MTRSQGASLRRYRPDFCLTLHLQVETTRSNQRRIQRLLQVRRRDHQHALIPAETADLVQQLVDGLAGVVAAANFVALPANYTTVSLAFWKRARTRFAPTPTSTSSNSLPATK